MAPIYINIIKKGHIQHTSADVMSENSAMAAAEGMQPFCFTCVQVCARTTAAVVHATNRNI